MRHDMFNSVNNPFGQRIESAISTGQDRQQKQQEQQDEEKRYLENDDKDEVQISTHPILTEEDILLLTRNYINNLKSQHPNCIQKLDKFLEKFDVKRFMKRNPNITSSDFHMLMFNETCKIIK